MGGRRWWWLAVVCALAVVVGGLILKRLGKVDWRRRPKRTGLLAAPSGAQGLISTQKVRTQRKAHGTRCDGFCQPLLDGG